jgi:hypothetical protein
LAGLVSLLRIAMGFQPVFNLRVSALTLILVNQASGQKCGHSCAKFSVFDFSCMAGMGQNPPSSRTPFYGSFAPDSGREIVRWRIWGVNRS